LDSQKLSKEIVFALKDLLSFGSKSMVGIDIGSSAVKVALMSKNKGQGYRLVSYGQSPVPEGAIIDDEIQNLDEIVKSVKDALKDGKITQHLAVVSIFGPSTVARKLPIALTEGDDLDDQISWEAEQYIPFPIEETKISHHVFGQNEGGGIDVLLVGAKQELVDSFVGVVEAAGLKVKIVDLGIIALANAFEIATKSKVADDESYLVLDFGAQSIKQIIYRANNLPFTKEISLGGSSITEEIQRQLGVSFLEAEELKTIGDGSGNLPEEVLSIISDMTDNMAGEVKKNVDFYLSSSADETLKKCFITGGSSLLPGITEKLENVLGIDVSYLNLFEEIAPDRKFKTEQLEEINYRGPIAIGLSARGLEGL
jgi:type IV pilus assembly protein PilM